eukprot:SAG31_NODE_28020_length_416_cov_1.299685_1_plen_32_part_01
MAIDGDADLSAAGAKAGAGRRFLARRARHSLR